MIVLLRIGARCFVAVIYFRLLCCFPFSLSGNSPYLLYRLLKIRLSQWRLLFCRVETQLIAFIIQCLLSASFFNHSRIFWSLSALILVIYRSHSVLLFIHVYDLFYIGYFILPVLLSCLILPCLFYFSAFDYSFGFSSLLRLCLNLSTCFISLFFIISLFSRPSLYEPLSYIRPSPSRPCFYLFHQLFNYMYM